MMTNTNILTVMVGADLTVTKQLDGYYQEIQENGGNRWDTSSLISRFKK